MPKPRKESKFYVWLLAQKDRDDVIGDLAIDVIRDKTWPKTRGDYHFLKNYMLVYGACKEAMQSLKEAQIEYKALER